MMFEISVVISKSESVKSGSSSWLFVALQVLTQNEILTWREIAIQVPSSASNARDHELSQRGSRLDDLLN